MIRLLRIVLALSSQLVVFTHAEEFVYGSRIIRAIFALDAAYAVALYIDMRRSSQSAANIKSWAHWGDTAWCIVMVSVSGGCTTIFFAGFLLPILAASFRWGFSAGMRVTVVSIFSFAAVSVALAHRFEAGFNLELLLLKSAFVLGLGYMIAHWGESEITLRRRLGFVDDTIGCSNPRFGIDRTVDFLLESLKDFYRAQRSLIILTDSKREEFLLHRSSANGDEDAAASDTIAPEMARPLLELSPQHAALCSSSRPPSRSVQWLWVGR